MNIRLCTHARMLIAVAALCAAGTSPAVPLPTHGDATLFDLVSGPGPGVLVPSNFSPIVGGGGFPPPSFFAPAVGVPFPAFDQFPSPPFLGRHPGCAMGLAFHIAPPGLNVGGMACSFEDTFSSPNPWHWESKITNPGGGAFYAGWFVGNVPIAAGVLVMGAGATFMMDIDMLEATFGLAETRTGPFDAARLPYFMSFLNGTGAGLVFDGAVSEGVGATPPGAWLPGWPAGGPSPVTGLPVTWGFAVDPPTDDFIFDLDVARLLLPLLGTGADVPGTGVSAPGGGALRLVTLRIPEPATLPLLVLAALLALRSTSRRQRS